MRTMVKCLSDAFLIRTGSADWHEVDVPGQVRERDLLRHNGKVHST